MTLAEAQVGKEYIIKEIVTEDEELDAFCLPWDTTAESR